ncbi:MAG TPA: flagellar export chaperone FlgN [Rhodanobacteraceae bacterium]|nr:flagellar export chaperone FlgN [Rhodanobacteraceae bacterium]
MNDLADQLHVEHEHLGRLLGLLDDERALLGAGRIDGEALGRLAAAKQATLDAVADAEAQRQALRRRRGHAADAAGDEATARAHDCLPLWHALRERARTVAARNHFNGELIALRMTSNQRLLNDLRTLAGKHLYGPDGQARGSETRLSSEA